MMALLTQKSLQEWKKQQHNKQDGKCALCDLPLENWQKANADHNHYTGHMRGLLHPLCNSILEGKIGGLFFRAGLKGKANFPTVLRNLADYWEQDYSEQPIHPSFVLDESKSFGKFTRERMIKELRGAGVDVDKTYSKESLIGIFKKTYREKLA
ncbi:endonuclease domain-containing protein [Atlantibacter hermannii]|uniref:endonuclease domain-containing protein n=1 Tax=Atlantibacter hermannii TaxID=565 RepID=UPI0037A28A19